jgi:ubiquinol-cytochrome c reductase cytochrome c subunit
MQIGFRGTTAASTVLLAVTLIASVAAQAGQAARAPQSGTDQGTPRDVASGRQSYTQTGCDTCHGTDGSGTAAAPRIAASSLQLQTFIAYVRKPTGTMPARSAEVISDRNLTDIYAYLHSAAVRSAQTTAPPAGSVAAGAMLYKKIGCYECHANEGQGGAQGPRLGPNPIPFARFGTYVRNPAGDMPPYTAKVLSDQDLATIYAFLEARPRPPAVNSIPLLAP